MGMESKYIWMDGELVDFKNATLHFLTPALHYGVGVFEGIRCYTTERGPAVFRLKEHTERLIDSAKVMGFRELPYSATEVSDSIRPLIYLTGGGWNLTVDAGRAAVGVAVWQWDNYLGEAALERGIRANIAS